MSIDTSTLPQSDTALPASTILRFGDAELRLASRELLLQGQAVPLGARAFDILTALAQRHGRVVSKRELMSLVWPDSVVEEANLRVNMAAIRKRLGPRIISTIPGRGYQFAEPVYHTTDKASEGAAPPPAGIPRFPADALPALIGREALLEQALLLMQQHRLVTLTGLSGSGKTRLAQAVQHTLCADPLTRVEWVDLAPLSHGDSIANSIARSCGLETGSADGLRGLIAALKPLALTLVLDNAEHLVDAVAGVAYALLSGCSQLQLLVTSQARLKLAAEVVLPVPPLPVAPVGTPFKEAQSAAAQALFLVRCEALGRPLPADQATFDELAILCGRLDGLPLALEYAAAAVPMLGLQGVSKSLDERRLSLTAGRRDAPQRHESLRSLLQWSHALLGSNEQTVFRRLGVFNGGCGLELFKEVVAFDFEDPWVGVEALSELIDRSLVVAVATEPPRYRLLETTRAYALELLVAHAEAHAINARRAEAVCLRQRRIHHAALMGDVPISDAVEQLLVEVDNAQGAWQWALEHDGTMALWLCLPLCYALRRSSGWGESTRCFAQTARHFNDSQPLALRAQWACAAGHHMAMQDRPRAREWLHFAVDAYRTLGEPQGLCWATAAWANWLMQGPIDRPAWQQALDELKAIDDDSWPDAVRAPGVVMAAKLDMALHGKVAARASLDLALALAACDPQARTLLLVHVMQIALQDDCSEDVFRIAEPLLPALREGRHRATLTFVLLCLTQAHLRTGRSGEARLTFKEGLPIACEHELLYLWGDALAVWACSQGFVEEAIWFIGYADSGYRLHGVERSESEMWFRRAAECQTGAALNEAVHRVAYRRGERSEDDAALTLATMLLQQS